MTDEADDSLSTPPAEPADPIEPTDVVDEPDDETTDDGSSAQGQADASVLPADAQAQPQDMGAPGIAQEAGSSSMKSEGNSSAGLIAGIAAGGKRPRLSTEKEADEDQVSYSCCSALFFSFFEGGDVEIAQDISTPLTISQCHRVAVIQTRQGIDDQLWLVLKLTSIRIALVTRARSWTRSSPLDILPNSISMVAKLRTPLLKAYSSLTTIETRWVHRPSSSLAQRCLAQTASPIRNHFPSGKTRSLAQLTLEGMLPPVSSSFFDLIRHDSGLCKVG